MIQSQKLIQAVRLALRLNPASVGANAGTAPADTALKTYMSQLPQLTRQTDQCIQRLEKSALVGDRSSAAVSLKEIAQTAGRLGLNQLAGLAGRLEAQVFQCSEESLASGIKLLKEEQAMINATVAGVGRPASTAAVQPRLNA